MAFDCDKMNTVVFHVGPNEFKILSATKCTSSFPLMEESCYLRTQEDKSAFPTVTLIFSSY